MEEIEPLLGARAELLDWDQRSVLAKIRSRAETFSAVRFFYGPQPFALARSLPIALSR